jgi:hypothetical protein
VFAAQSKTDKDEWIQILASFMKNTSGMIPPVAIPQDRTFVHSRASSRHSFRQRDDDAMSTYSAVTCLSTHPSIMTERRGTVREHAPFAEHSIISAVETLVIVFENIDFV